MLLLVSMCVCPSLFRSLALSLSRSLALALTFCLSLSQAVLSVLPESELKQLCLDRVAAAEMEVSFFSASLSRCLAVSLFLLLTLSVSAARWRAAPSSTCPLCLCHLWSAKCTWSY